MKNASIDLVKYPWYPRHAVAVRTTAHMLGMDLAQVVEQLDRRIRGEQSDQPELKLDRAA